MNKALTNIKQAAIELWRDDSGAQLVEKILIVAAISLPLLALLLFFSSEIKEWIADRWEEVQGDANSNNAPSDNPF